MKSSSGPREEYPTSILKTDELILEVRYSIDALIDTSLQREENNHEIKCVRIERCEKYYQFFVSYQRYILPHFHLKISVYISTPLTRKGSRAENN